MSTEKAESYDFDRHEDAVRLPLIPPSDRTMAIEVLLAQAGPPAEITLEDRARMLGGALNRIGSGDVTAANQSLVSPEEGPERPLSARQIAMEAEWWSRERLGIKHPPAEEPEK